MGGLYPWGQVHIQLTSTDGWFIPLGTGTHTTYVYRWVVYTPEDRYTYNLRLQMGGLYPWGQVHIQLTSTDGWFIPLRTGTHTTYVYRWVVYTPEDRYTYNIRLQMGGLYPWGQVHTQLTSTDGWFIPLRTGTHTTYVYRWVVYTPEDRYTYNLRLQMGGLYPWGQVHIQLTSTDGWFIPLRTGTHTTYVYRWVVYTPEDRYTYNLRLQMGGLYPWGQVHIQLTSTDGWFIPLRTGTHTTYVYRWVVYTPEDRYTYNLRLQMGGLYPWGQVHIQLTSTDGWFISLRTGTHTTYVYRWVVYTPEDRYTYNLRLQMGGLYPWGQVHTSGATHLPPFLHDFLHIAVKGKRDQQYRYTWTCSKHK